MLTVHQPPVSQPQPAPSPGCTAIARGILAAGCGPEEIPWLVAGFEQAAELEQEIRTALAAMTPLEAQMSSAGIGAVLSASGPS